MKKYIPLILYMTLFLTAGRCSLEDDIVLDKQFVKTESRKDGAFLLRQSDHIVYIVGVSNEFDSQIAIDTATARARGALARQVRQISAQLIGDYLTGVGCDSENERFAQLVSSMSNDIAQMSLYQSETERVYEDKASDPHTFFVLVKFDIDIIKNNLEKIVNPITEHYIKLGPSKSMFDFRAFILGWTADKFQLPEKVIK